MRKFSQLDPNTQHEVSLYVGTNFHEVYLPRWLKMEGKNSQFSWNWASFFFSTLWLAYRKVNGLAYGLLGVFLLLDLILFHVLNLNPDTYTIDFGTSVVIGLLGNHLYLQHAIKKVEQLQREIPIYEQRLSILQSKSGGSWANMWLYVFVCLAYGFISVILTTGFSV